MSGKNRKADESTIRMKCLVCLHEECLDADILLEYAEANDMIYPQVVCPECGYESLVPKVVFPYLYVPGPAPEKKKPLGRPKKRGRKANRISYTN